MNNPPPKTGHQDELEFLSFRLGQQDFCIDIMAVREIRGWTPATALPHAPGYVCGVVNLRGAVLPIIDLGARLGLPVSERTPQHVIMVVEVGSHILGLLVDAVNDIVTVAADNIQPTPELTSGLAASYVTGLITFEGRMLALLQLTELVLPEQRHAA